MVHFLNANFAQFSPCSKSSNLLSLSLSLNQQLLMETPIDSTTNLEPPPTPTPTAPDDLQSKRKAQTAIEALSTILSSPLPTSITASKNPAFSLLHDPQVAAQVSSLLRHPNSGAGHNNLCRWLYDTFQSSDPTLQLVVLRFLPSIAGLYLSRVALRKPLAGFEAVLLALYAHETTARNSGSITVSIPDLSHPSIYHETKSSTAKNSSTEINLAVISPTLEPHGTVRSTRRARIIGVALELYFSRIYKMPADSKISFCDFCVLWAGQDGDMYIDGPDSEIMGGKRIEKEKEKEEEGGRIPLQWEILQPILRILGHCLMDPDKDEGLHEAASAACRCLHARAMHDVNPKAILATGSLLRLVKMGSEPNVGDFDPTEIPKDNGVSV